MGAMLFMLIVGLFLLWICWQRGSTKLAHEEVCASIPFTVLPTLVLTFSNAMVWLCWWQRGTAKLVHEVLCQPPDCAPLG